MQVLRPFGEGVGYINDQETEWLKLNSQASQANSKFERVEEARELQRRLVLVTHVNVFSSFLPHVMIKSH